MQNGSIDVSHTSKIPHMAEKSSEQLNIEIAQKLQERFDTYLVSLIFTLLGLSVQTAKFVAVPATVMEIAGWACLLFAGLAGLSRFESMPHAYKLAGLRHGKEDMARETQRAILQGAREFYVTPLKREVPAEQYLAETEESIRKIAEHQKPLDRRLSRTYRATKYSFVCGLVLLLGARAYPPIASIVSSVQS